MPYGNSYPKRSDGNITQTWNGAPVGTPFVVAGQYQKHGAVGYVRTGTNAPKRAVSTCPRVTRQVSYVWKWVTVPGGKKLASKVYNKKLGKMIYARAPILVKRLVKVYPPKQKRGNMKGLILAPNALSYQSAMVAYFGENTDVVATNGSNTWRASGALWAPFVPYGNLGAIEPNASNYTGVGISSRFSSYVSRADTIATKRLYERVKMQEVNLAQALAEHRQTAKLFLELCKRLFGFWIRLKRGNLSAAMVSLFPTTGKQLANDHLAIQYGVRPLLSDLQGIVETLTKPKDIVFDVVIRRREEVPRALIDGASGPLGVTRHSTQVYSFGYVEVKYKYTFRLSSAGMAAMRVLTELGFGNLNSLAYELIPFSFVVDWFLPIGSYLNNMDAFDNLQIVHATKTVFQKEYIEFRRTWGGTNGGYTTLTSSSGFICERVKVDRSLTGIPAVPTPQFKDPISKLHIANAIALISQLKG